MAFVDEGTKSDANQEGAIERKTNNTITKQKTYRFLLPMFSVEHFDLDHVLGWRYLH